MTELTGLIKFQLIATHQKCNSQVSKKEKVELPKTVTITPSENTHFRVILSSEAMQTDEREPASGTPGCTIVKPEPRTPVTPKTPTESELGTVSSGVLTSTPTNSLPAASAAASAAHVVGDLGDVGPKTDSPSKKKGGPVKHLNLSDSVCSWFDGLACQCLLSLFDSGSVGVDKVEIKLWLIHV